MRHSHAEGTIPKPKGLTSVQPLFNRARPRARNWCWLSPLLRKRQPAALPHLPDGKQLLQRSQRAKESGLQGLQAAQKPAITSKAETAIRSWGELTRRGSGWRSEGQD